MVRMLSNLSRWLGLLGTVVLCATVAAPAHADKMLGLSAKQSFAGVAAGSRQGRLADRKESADTWNANHASDYAGSSILMGGRTVMRFRVGSGGYTAQQRYGIVQGRLIDTLGLHDGSSSSVRVASVGGDPVIYLRGRQFVTVTEADARANGATPLDLAYAWAANLRRGLASMDQ